jgi:hypothetical protein
MSAKKILIDDLWVWVGTNHRVHRKLYTGPAAKALATKFGGKAVPVIVTEVEQNDKR